MPRELKPCPFCGGTNIRFDEHHGEGRRMHSGETVWSMCCYDCGVAFPNRYRRELLEDAWNARVDADRIEALATALEPFVTGYSHTSVFLSSREKMHSAGQDLYREEVESARAALAAYRSVK